MVQLVEGLPRLPLTYLSNGPGCLGQACQSPLVLYNYCCPAVGYGLNFSNFSRGVHRTARLHFCSLRVCSPFVLSLFSLYRVLTGLLDIHLLWF